MPNQHEKQFHVKNVHQNKDRCSSVEILAIQKAFNALQGNISVKLATSLGTLPAFATRKKQAPYKSKKPKVHQIQAGAVYAKESIRFGQSEEYSSSDESFCLQMKVQWTQSSENSQVNPPNNKSGLQIEFHTIQETCTLEQD